MWIGREHFTRLEQKVDLLTEAFHRERMMLMHTMQELLAEISGQKGQIESLRALNASTRQAVQDALAAAKIQGQVTVDIDTIFDAVHANSAELVAAINDGSAPAAPAAATAAPVEAAPAAASAGTVTPAADPAAPPAA